MIKKCFTHVLDTDANNESSEYLFSEKFVLNKYADGYLLFVLVSRNIDVSNEVIFDYNVPDRHPTCTYVADRGGWVLSFDAALPLTTGYLVLKDTRNLVVRNTFDLNNTTFHFTTGMYANINKDAALAFTSPIRLKGNVVSGDIADFSKFINLSTLQIGASDMHSSISGTLESLADGLLSYGKESGSLEVICNGIVTYNGTAIPSNTSKTITFSDGSYSIT